MNVKKVQFTFIFFLFIGISFVFLEKIVYNDCQVKNSKKNIKFIDLFLQNWQSKSNKIKKQ